MVKLLGLRYRMVHVYQDNSRPCFFVWACICLLVFVPAFFSLLTKKPYVLQRLVTQNATAGISSFIAYGSLIRPRRVRYVCFTPTTIAKRAKPKNRMQITGTPQESNLF